LPADTVITFLPIHPGWGETFQGLPTQAWLPSLRVRSTAAGGASLELTIEWAEGQTVVLEASDSLSWPGWVPVSTNRLPSFPFSLTVPQPDMAASRFFRVSPATSSSSESLSRHTPP
jgi:hypothetical protein